MSACCSTRSAASSGMRGSVREPLNAASALNRRLALETAPGSSSGAASEYGARCRSIVSVLLRDRSASGVAAMDQTSDEASPEAPDLEWLPSDAIHTALVRNFAVVVMWATEHSSSSSRDLQARRSLEI